MHIYMEKLARFFAILGGLVLTILIVLSCLSIAGRSLNSLLYSDAVQNFVPGFANLLLASGVGPINGDFELVEAGLAFAIFSFIPLCQLHGAHASVDLFTAQFPDSVNRVLRTLIEIIFAAVLVLIAVKMTEGMWSKYKSGQVSLLLQLPIWWAYALSLLGAYAAAITGVYLAVMRVVEIATGTEILPIEEGAVH